MNNKETETLSRSAEKVLSSPKTFGNCGYRIRIVQRSTENGRSIELIQKDNFLNKWEDATIADLPMLSRGGYEQFIRQSGFGADLDSELLREAEQKHGSK